MENIIYFFYNTSCLNEEVNCTEPSRRVSLPCLPITVLSTWTSSQFQHVTVVVGLSRIGPALRHDHRTVVVRNFTVGGHSVRRSQVEAEPKVFFLYLVVDSPDK
jgi:hypothetical protein